VPGEKEISANADWVRLLGPGQDADDDVVDVRAGAKEETAVEGPAGDLDEGAAFGDVTESSHTPIKRKNRSRSCKPPPALGLRRVPNPLRWPRGAAAPPNRLGSGSTGRQFWGFGWGFGWHPVPFQLAPRSVEQG